MKSMDGFLKYRFISAVIIKGHSSLDGVSRIIGRVARPKAVGASKAVDGVNKVGEAVGKDTVKGHTARQDTVSNRDTATAIGTTGINSITTISIGASNNRAGRQLQLAAKL